MNDPVAAGLVASLGRPGGNITGVSNMAEDILLKFVELLHEALPAARRIAVMTNPNNPSHPAMLDSLRKYAVTAGFSVEPVAAASPADLDMAFAGLSQWRPDALFV